MSRRVDPTFKEMRLVRRFRLLSAEQQSIVTEITTMYAIEQLRGIRTLLEQPKRQGKRRPI